MNGVEAVEDHLSNVSDDALNTGETLDPVVDVGRSEFHIEGVSPRLVGRGGSTDEDERVDKVHKETITIGCAFLNHGTLREVLSSANIDTLEEAKSIPLDIIVPSGGHNDLSDSKENILNLFEIESVSHGLNLSVERVDLLLKLIQIFF